MAAPQLGRLVADFPPRRPGFGPRSGHVRFVVDKVALGKVFSEYFGFPCQFSFHLLLHTQHLSSGAGTICQVVADVPSGLSGLAEIQSHLNPMYTKAYISVQTKKLIKAKAAAVFN
jgi:hypothetical protein